MEFTYKSVTGSITIDVDEEWVAILRDCDRLEANNDLKERRRHYHLEACEYEGEDFAVEDRELERLLETEAAKSALEPALCELTKSQRQLIDALFYRHMSAREYADSRGVTEAAVSKAKNAAFKKMKKVLSDG